MTTQSTPKKLYIKTWGCQMNEYDSHRMADTLRGLGYTLSDAPDDADMVVLNTCHIREKATDKVFSELGRLRDHKEARAKNGQQTVIAVAGCVAQAEGDVITSRAPYVDMVIGPQAYGKLPEMVIAATGGHARRQINTDFPAVPKFDEMRAAVGTQGPSAFLSIQEGCDKFCTFCVVPYTRGSEYSRTIDDIMDEAHKLVQTGARDITLLGQNVNAFHGIGPDGSTWGIGKLMRSLASIDGLDRIRYMTSHPRDCDDDMIAVHADCAKVMPFLHLPVQSGSDKILAAMNRKHTANEYRTLIARFRAARPDIALSSDFIIGFPGETEEDHQATLQLLDDIKFTSVYSFKYSARPGTPAANMPGLVPEQIKDRRLHELQAVAAAHARGFNTPFIGKHIPVLFDRYTDDGQLHGKSPYNQSVHCAGNARLVGQIMDVEITSASATALSGQIPQSMPE